MNSVLKNVLGFVAGVIVGGAVNMGIVKLSGFVIPLPEGVDPTNMESLKESMHLFEARHFIFPFLAHAAGTFVGALLAAWIAVTHKMKFALAVGGVFLLGGIANTIMLPAPTWFVVLDLVVAYIPMAWLGMRLAEE